MGKKITSLLLTLAMIVAIVPCLGPVYADDSPVVTYKFYKDAELTTPVGDSSVDVGDVVYGAVSVSGTSINQVAAFVGFSTDCLQLVNFDSDDAVTIPDGGLKGTGAFGAVAANIGQYGVKISPKSVIKLTFHAGEEDPFIVKDGNDGILHALFTSMGTTGYDYSDDTVFIVLKLKAIKGGTATLSSSPATYAEEPTGTKIYLKGSKNISFVLFLVPSGNNPIAPLFFNIFKACSVAFLSFISLLTGIHPTSLKNQANFPSKYSFLAK